MKMSYYPESDSHNRSKIKVELDFSNFATKSEVKKATGVLASKFAIKAGLANKTNHDTKIQEIKEKDLDLDK